MIASGKLFLTALVLFFLGCSHRVTVRNDFPFVSAPSQPITLAFVGDILLGASSLQKLEEEGPHVFFEHTAAFLQAADITCGNLEGPLSLRGTPFQHKTFTFRTPPKAAEGLKQAGFDVVTLANNHIMDFGLEALEDTQETLTRHGIAFCGAGRNLEEARRPACLTVKGKNIAFLSYSRTLPADFWATRTRAGCAPAFENFVTEDIRAARAEGADFVIVQFHWGQEKSTHLRAYQKTLAYAAIASGADAVIGHHPHIWQPLELYQGKPIAYSIGNFTFGSRSSSVSTSGILYLIFDPNGSFLRGEILPLDVNNFRVHFVPKQLDPPHAQSFFHQLAALSPNAVLTLLENKIYWEVP